MYYIEMDKIKKERKPRQPKAEKPKAKPREKKKSSYDQFQTQLIGNHNITNEKWFKKSFLQDFKIIEDEIIKKQKKVNENPKLSMEAKKKKLDKIVKDNTKLLIKVADDCKKNPEFYKTMFHKNK
jgi:hypothetical protein